MHLSRSSSELTRFAVLPGPVVDPAMIAASEWSAFGHPHIPVVIDTWMSDMEGTARKESCCIGCAAWSERYVSHMRQTCSP